jgi:hypothetical protein
MSNLTTFVEITEVTSAPAGRYALATSVTWWQIPLALGGVIHQQAHAYPSGMHQKIQIITGKDLSTDATMELSSRLRFLVLQLSLKSRK